MVRRPGWTAGYGVGSWVAANIHRRYMDHHEHGRMLLAERVAGFLDMYPNIDFPEFDPAERKRLDKAFGAPHAAGSGSGRRTSISELGAQHYVRAGRSAVPVLGGV